MPGSEPGGELPPRRAPVGRTVDSKRAADTAVGRRASTIWRFRRAHRGCGQ
jgi:hypothetical protein